MLKRYFISCSLAGVLSCVGASVLAQGDDLSKLPVDQRLQRLERLTSSEVLREQAETIEALRQEITLLREQIEQQGYELETLKQRQRSLYVDMDRRISGVESGGTRLSGTRPPVPPPNTTGTKTTTRVQQTSGNDKDGKDDYQQAFTLLKEGRYQPSIKAFEGFLKKYPQSRYADNAQYWLGEANYVSRQYKQALGEFQRLISQYPESTKNPGARLKIGYVYYELHNWSAAKEALQKVVKLFPDTSVARKATERLKRIKREGH